MLTRLVLAVVLPVCVMAQVSLKPYNTTAAVMFSVSDINKDGIITFAEIEANFKSYDTDNNGRISRYEYTSYVDKNSPDLHAFAHGLYDIYDVDSDDVLDLHDFQNFFRLIDSNSDGVIVQQEYVRYFVIVLESLEYLHGSGRRSSKQTKHNL